MNLLSLKSELEQLKRLRVLVAGSGCVCEYVEVVDGQELTTEQEHILKNNQECYERHNDRNAHVGFSSILLPAPR